MLHGNRSIVNDPHFAIPWPRLLGAGVHVVPARRGIPEAQRRGLCWAAFHKESLPYTAVKIWL
jgi:hypothetical protein